MTHVPGAFPNRMALRKVVVLVAVVVGAIAIGLHAMEEARFASNADSAIAASGGNIQVAIDQAVAHLHTASRTLEVNYRRFAMLSNC
ncbi:unnamed protein product (mitochondrion) [Plasmodiophora brassicae]|uniref:Uncharacterized protein n=1 Tax=Plasmodiophora brassicae TaxID=37360 RepID=A0A3P3Y671_PLABS|nr:unnamed protein product [Plasmodiophora brassicae]